jgi:hypothetical protein
MKQSKKLAVVMAGVMALGLVALAGCAVQGGTSDQAPATKNAAQPDNNAPDGQVVSTAMVAYANGNEVMFVDQETQTPYIPTNLDAATIIYDGQDIDEDDLIAGNIVQVTGNGIMLESYPGITKVEVVEQGNPADAEQYADIVDTVFAAPDQSQVPVGNLEYKTTDAQVAVMLNPVAYEWEWVQQDGTADEAEVSAEAFNADGTLAETVADARITGATDAFAAFSVNPTAIEIERRPLAATDAPAVDPTGQDEDVACTLGEDGAAAFSMEPGFLYELKATFPQGEAEYAFYTVS